MLTNFRLNQLGVIFYKDHPNGYSDLFVFLRTGNGGYCGYHSILRLGGGWSRLVVHKKSAKNAAGIAKGLEEF